MHVRIEEVSADDSRSDPSARRAEQISTLELPALPEPTGVTNGSGTKPLRRLPAAGRAADSLYERVRVQRGLPGVRAVRFGLVAVVCTGMQLAVLGFLTHHSVDRLVANGIGYVLAAQSSFVLSSIFTWGDRKPRLAKHTRSARVAKTRAWSARWVKFNTTGLAALAVNEVVFGAAVHAGLATLPAASAAILGAAVVTFSVNHAITFRGPSESGETEHRPALDQIRRIAQEQGIAFFLPAFNEAANLKALIPQIVDYFYDLACPFTVIIVDDGSARDDTYEVAERLAEAYPGHVQAVHHAKNKGYGAALQTGLNSALRAGHGLIGFCDADDQFDIKSFGTLLVALQSDAADISIGYRIARADAPHRRLMGSAWRRLSSLALGASEMRDIDCGFKLFTRRVLEDILPDLRGRYAAISPEILYRATAGGYKISEAGVTHKSRTHGRPTGSNPKVIVLSLLNLVQLRMELRKPESYTQQQDVVTLPAPLRDNWAWATGIVATALSVSAYVTTVRLHAVLLYTDSISHMEIARRVLDGSDPGLGQFGGVWLPLQHMLMTVLIWNNALYRSGLAGSIVSMVAYVVTTVLIYKIVARLTGQPIAGAVAATVFALSPNVLYMQSTPMTESLLYCTTAGMIYGVLQWANTDRYQYLMGGAFFAFLGTLTRYEAWPIAVCLLFAVAFIAWYRRSDGLDKHTHWAGARDRVTAFSVVAFGGIAGWALWNWILFGSPLYFQSGPYAKPSLWIVQGDIGLGNWPMAAKTFMYAMKYDETWPLLALAGVGLVAFLAIEWRKKRTFARSLAVLSLLIMIPFFIASIYTGQRPLYVVPLYYRTFNIRFALIMLLPTAIFIGYLIASLKRWRAAMFVAAGLVVLMTVSIGVGLIRYDNVVTYSEAAEPSRILGIQLDTVGFLKSHYDGGKVLMQEFFNERVAFEVPSNELVYEGSFREWLPALREPAANHIRWIIESCGSARDLVCRNEKRAQLSPYKLVYISPGAVYRVYELRS